MRAQPWGDKPEDIFSEIVFIFFHLNRSFEGDWHVLCLALELFLGALNDRSTEQYVRWPVSRVPALIAAVYSLARKQIGRGSCAEHLGCIADEVFAIWGHTNTRTEAANIECWLFHHYNCCIPPCSRVATAVDEFGKNFGHSLSRQVQSRECVVHLFWRMPTPVLLSLDATMLAFIAVSAHSNESAVEILESFKST